MDKICTRCKQKYPNTKEYFYEDSRKPGRLLARCIKCHNELAMERYRTRHRDRIELRQSEREQYNPRPGVKICKKCLTSFDSSVEFFRPVKGNRDGLSGVCRACTNRYSNEYQKRKRAPAVAQRKRERQNWIYPGQGVKRCTRCERVKSLLDFNVNRDGDYSSECRDCHHAMEHRFRRSNAESLARKRLLLRAAQKLKVLIHYGGEPPCCACCGESTLEFLAIDHIAGGGSRERKEIGSGFEFFRKLIKMNFPPGYRVLCHNCNFATGVYGSCPHT